MTEHQILIRSEARAVVWARSMGRCEKCGGPLQADEWECHHRLLRSAGGVWCPCNLIALHARCHNQHRDSVHDNPMTGYLDGTLVLRGQDPAMVMIEIPSQGRHSLFLSCGGTYA